MPQNKTPSYSGGNRSSVMDRIPELDRFRIDRAIMDYSPRSLRKIYQLHRVFTYGVSERAFFRYARTVRHRSDVIDFADRAAPQSHNISTNLPAVVGQCLMEDPVKPRKNIAQHTALS